MSILSRRELIATPLVLAQGAEPKPSIWDVHCHLTSAEGSTPEERMAYLIRFMDRLGIERVMLSLGYPLLADPSPEQLREANDQVLKAVARWPDRALGFVYLNPNQLAFSLGEFDRCVRDGPMVGVKLWVAKRCNAPELDSIVERAAAMQAPILQHAWFNLKGNLPGESTPNDLAELAMRHPKAVFIDAHTGGDWERGILALRPAKNVATCVAGFDPTAGIVEMAVRELGAERVMFGSDAAGRSFASQLGKVMGAEIPERSRRLILGENLRRILTPILREKGRPV
ncbi:MAG TPA: amidohydrolase family protein [Bryobacteraceae bacterium]|nr:amidohydrolase family protein [Bryobacteraceae bacterium]